MMSKNIYIIAGGVLVFLIIGYFIKEAMKKQFQKMLPIEELERQFDSLAENQKIIAEYLMKGDHANKYLEVDKYDIS